MNLQEITPLVITWNEEANIERCLDRLQWAKEIIVLDSGSTDSTRQICDRFAQVRFVIREFDSHAGQCNFGLSLVGTPWVLALDADYILGDGFENEVATITNNEVFGFSASFRYCVFGKALRGTLYPARVVLHRVQYSDYWQDGHAHRLRLNGDTRPMLTKICHDDRKPLGHWHSAQVRYARLEADKLNSVSDDELSFADRLRKQGWIAPWVILFWCLFVKGCALDGIAGWYYTMQRVLAELALAVELLDRRLRKETK